MKLSLPVLKLILFVLQTTGKTDVNGQLMPRFFEAKERPLATELFKKVKSEAEKSPEQEVEVVLSEEEKSLLITLLEIPLAMQDSLLAEEFISLLKENNV